MAVSYPSPAWFLGYDAILEFAFSAVAFIVSLSALRIYKKTSSKEVLAFSRAFSLIALSYVVQALANVLIFLKIRSGITQMSGVYYVLFLDTAGLLLYMALMVSGISLLLTIKEGGKAGAFVAIPSVLAILFTENPALVFHVLMSLALGYLLIRFWLNYRKARRASALSVALAFTFLFVGNCSYAMPIAGPGTSYALAHFLSFLAYILILASLYLVSRGK